MSAPRDDRPSLVRVGEVFAGRYRIDEQVGHGGFGAVFRATQIDTSRTVALKVLLPELCDSDEGMRRFEREARLAQRLEHPNSVRLFDFGRAGEVPFLVMEYLRGQTLYAVMRAERTLAAPRVARIASQVLKSLMEAHGLGIVHRDVKPANVFLCEYFGETDFVKLLDFGVAKSTAPRTIASALTQEGHTVGTANYMAPEQVTGKGACPASDLYALGLVMAEALTGERVYNQGAPLEICMQQMSPDPVPLPRAVLDQPIGRVIARATYKPLDQRYATADQMLVDLEPLARPAAGASEPPTTHVAAAVQPPTQPYAMPPGHAPGWTPHPPGAMPIAPVAFSSAPPPATPALRPARRGGGGWLALALLGGLVAVGSVIGASVYVLADASEVTSGAGAPRGPGTTRAPAAPGESARRVRDMTREQLRAIVEAEGFEVKADRVVKDPGPGYETLELEVQKDPLTHGLVRMTRCRDIEQAIKLAGGKNTVRDEKVVLSVIISSKDDSESRLFAALTR